MPSPEDPRSTGNARAMLLAIAACCLYVLLLAWMPAFTAGSPVLCLTRRLFGLNCPSCGLTRAMACLARLDPGSAVLFHPLVFLVAPLVAVFVIDTGLAAIGRKGVIEAIPLPLVRVFWGLLIAGFGVVFVVRTASWIAPDCNTCGWMIPPATFPP